MRTQLSEKKAVASRKKEFEAFEIQRLRALQSSVARRRTASTR